MHLQQPFPTPTTHQPLLSLIQSTPILPLPLTIPLPDNIDVSAQVLHNTNRLDDTPDVEIEQVLHFVPMKHMIPQNRKDQLCTVVLKNLPRLRQGIIEKMLKMMSKDDAFEWSEIDNFDNKVVFVRYSSVLGAARVVQHTIPVEMAADPGLDKDVEPYEVDTQAVAKLIGNKRHIEKSYSGTEDLDQVLQTYSNYTVDKNELVDVPSSMAEGITRDIIKFRSEVLIMEKEARRRQMERERKKAKERLKGVFEDVVKVDTQTEEESVDSNELPHLSDTEYEKHMQKLLFDRQSAEYRAALSAVHSLEAEYKRKLETLRSVQNYEADLMDSKLQYIEEFSDLSRSLYYTDHAAYLRQRIAKRDAEKGQDAQFVGQKGEKDVRRKILELVGEYFGVDDEYLQEWVYKAYMGDEEAYEEIRNILEGDAGELMEKLRKWSE